MVLKKAVKRIQEEAKQDHANADTIRSAFVKAVKKDPQLAIKE